MLCAFAAVPAAAEDGTASRLVNVDTPVTIGRGRLGIGLDVRLMRGNNGTDNTTLSARYGITSRLEVGIRGVTAGSRVTPVGVLGNITHGGRDAEAFAKYDFGRFGPAHLGLLAGISTPSTTSQNQAIGTLSASAAVQAGDRVTIIVNPKAVLNKGRTLVGVGGGFSARAAQNFYLVGDYTTIAAGDNTRSLTTGAAVRRDVWGAALRLHSVHNGTELMFDLGWGNAVGSTTGFSLSPGLGSAQGLYFALTARR
jgi:hypothetical protein